MSGIVKAPVVAASETGLPETIPKLILEMIATFADPPLYLPVKALARLIKRAPAPDFSMKDPKRIKIKT
ncbi:hypothetical protein JCM12294_41200 [Desulfocicer niacini]